MLSTEDEAWSGRPVEVQTDANAQRVCDLIREDRRLAVRMLASELGMNRETVRHILTGDFGMKKLCAKMVAKNLSEKQKQHQMTVAENCLEQVETKRQSSQWLSPHAPRAKARMSKSKVKTMIITFFDSRGIVHKEFFVPAGQTVNQITALSVFQYLAPKGIAVLQQPPY